MVELRLESLGEVNLPKECFVSVRIGETQKLSRLASSRVYRFPQAGDRRYGKIEVFRRIGAASIDVDPQSAGTREVNINCSEGGFGNLGLRIGVEDEDKKPKSAEPSAPKKEGSKVKAAKEYLSKHGLEVRLSEAMQAVLRERPADPAEFLAAKLLADSPNAANFKIPVSSTSPPQHQTRKAAPVAQPAVQAVLPFKSFYHCNFKSMDTSAFARCHAKFPAKHVKHAKPTPPPAAPLRTRPSIGTWMNPLPRHRQVAKSAPAQPAVVAVLPFKSFYQSNFKFMDAGSFARFHSKFPAKHAKPSPPAAAPKPANMRMRPSIGTWMMPLPRNKQAAKAAPVVEVKKPQSAPFMLKPSVGTWLVKTPPKVKIVVPKFTQKASVGTWLSPIPVRLQRSMREAAAASQAATPPTAYKPTFRHKPSVATWLAALPEPVTEEAAFHLRPSVGTWLMALPPAEEEVVPEAPNAMVMSSMNRFGAAFSSLGLRPMMMVF